MNSLEYYRNWRKKNLEKVREYARKWAREHYDENRKEYYRKYYQSNKDKRIERDKDKSKKWREENPDKVKDYYIKKIKGKYTIEYYKVPQHRIDRSMSGSIWLSLKSKKGGRRWEQITGYTIQDLMDHLEQRFDKNMSWNNYGKYWHIDHIIPKSHFKYQTEEDIEFKKCWSLSNLQPLEAIENIKKGNRIPKL